MEELGLEGQEILELSRNCMIFFFFSSKRGLLGTYGQQMEGSGEQLEVEKGKGEKS